MRKWFYVLELAGGCYYVGISSNFMRRSRQHDEGAGAVWTRLHPPIGVLFQYEHEVGDDRAAELIEDEMTVRLMVEHGWRKVRGGHFCTVSEAQVEQALRAHGHWDRVLQSSIKVEAIVDDWPGAWQTALALGRAFHDGGCAVEARDAALAHLMRLRQHRHWRADLEPVLEEKFWGPRGVLRVLLTLHANQVVGFRLPDPYAVLHAGMQMGPMGERPWGHLFLAAWETYCPAATAAQVARVTAYLGERHAFHRDRRYDRVAAMLFPELRWRLEA